MWGPRGDPWTTALQGCRWALSWLWEFAWAPEPVAQTRRMVSTAGHCPLVLGAGRLSPRCPQAWFLLGLHPCCVGSCLLPMSSGGQPLCASVPRSLPPLRTPAVLDPVTSSHSRQLFKGPVLKGRDPLWHRGLGLPYLILGDTAQPLGSLWDSGQSGPKLSCLLGVGGDGQKGPELLSRF